VALQLLVQLQVQAEVEAHQDSVQVLRLLSVEMVDQVVVEAEEALSLIIKVEMEMNHRFLPHKEMTEEIQDHPQDHHTIRLQVAAVELVAQAHQVQTEQMLVTVELT
tara:strand:+ start:158 stop:478 length:321 start_codon:yes stop_codon:yes gene_type:complete